MTAARQGEDPWVQVKTRSGLQADEVISALQKEIRRGHTENAAALAYEMSRSSQELEAVLWQRLKVISVEDIGFGDTHAPVLIDALNGFRQSFDYGEGDRILFAVHAVRYLSMSVKDRSSDEMSQWLRYAMDGGGMKPDIPDYALDMHTQRGIQMGRDREHFFEEASRISPELADRDLTYLDRLLKALADGGL